MSILCNFKKTKSLNVQPIKASPSHITASIPIPNNNTQTEKNRKLPATEEKDAATGKVCS
jgi:hypothetical protein